MAQLNDSQSCTDEATIGFAAKILWITTALFFLATRFNQQSKKLVFVRLHLNTYSVVITHFLSVNGR